MLSYELMSACEQGRNTRNAELTRLADHIRNVYVKRDRTWIVLFPEGGFLCNRKESSQAYVPNDLYYLIVLLTDRHWG